MYSLSQVVQYHWQKSDKDSRRNHACQNTQKGLGVPVKMSSSFPKYLWCVHTYSTLNIYTASKEEMDKKKRQAEEEEYEKMKALQREKVQAKKLSTS